MGNSDSVPRERSLVSDARWGAEDGRGATGRTLHVAAYPPGPQYLDDREDDDDDDDDEDNADEVGSDDGDEQSNPPLDGSGAGALAGGTRSANGLGSVRRARFHQSTRSRTGAGGSRRTVNSIRDVHAVASVSPFQLSKRIYAYNIESGAERAQSMNRCVHALPHAMFPSIAPSPSAFSVCDAPTPPAVGMLQPCFPCTRFL